ncbi:acyltransferase family protein [Knoellia sp. CPCC 206450]|uniref:acyltransferase family protein n=1 Tax=Knoellia tibetensis TaxID=3404798 RepID=UPI003B4320F1
MTSVLGRAARSVDGSHARDRMLDGLRGVAAIAVVHYHFLLLSGLNGEPGAGLIGVLVFFVLSGYLITRLLWRADGREGPTYRRFVERRVRRLAPALVGLVVVSGVLVTVAGPGDAGDAVAGSLVVLAQLTGFWHVLGSMPVEAWLPTWSLTVEWLFYLLWPLVVVAMRRRGLSTSAAMRVALALAAGLYLASMPLSPNAFYYLPVGNLAVMLVGAALALAHAREPARTTGRDAGIADLAFVGFVVAVLVPTTGLSGSWLYRVTYVPIAVVVALLLIDQRPGTGGVARRLLESRPMVAVGQASYSLYLWHLPLLWAAFYGLPGLSVGARVLVATVALGPVVWLSFTLLEKPVLTPAPYAVHSRSGAPSARSVVASEAAEG